MTAIKSFTILATVYLMSINIGYEPLTSGWGLFCLENIAGVFSNPSLATGNLKWTKTSFCF